MVDARAMLGEGPMWHERAGELLWVDILQDRIHRYDPRTGVDRTLEAAPLPSAVVPHARGGLLVALRDGFAHLDEAGGEPRWIARPESGRPINRMNDGKCDPMGRFWCGSMNRDEKAASGALYCLDPNGQAREVFGSVTVSNGLDWSLDGTRLYYVDSPTRRIDVLDCDLSTGAVGNRRTLVAIAEGCGFPDGLTVDDEGFLWVALWDGAALHRYTPEGTLDRVVEIPAARVTSCAFGGPELRDLYVTSARVGLTSDQLEERPLAGALFRYRPGVAGRRPGIFGAVVGP